MHRVTRALPLLLAIVAATAGCISATRRAPLSVSELPDVGPVESATDAAVLVDAVPPWIETAPEAPPPGGAELAETEPVSVSPLDELAAIEPAPSERELAEERTRVAAAPPTFDIPMEINDLVLAWVDLYSGPMKNAFEAGLVRSGRYLAMFREIFREAGVPEDLVYMAHVESGYKTSAYSRAHARGIFQFISATARRYGLRVDYWTDERADPEKSARAAAVYMKDLYAEFGDWYLALAAYNAGEGKIRRALSRSGHDDFWGIARTAYLRRETKNHVPAILAATLLSKQARNYGLTDERESPLAYDSVPVEGAADLRVLARCAQTDVESLRELNPALRRLQTPPDGVTDVRVPLGAGARMAAALAEIPTAERVLYARHRVRQGDTLSTIAAHYGVGVTAIQDANHMGRRTLIRANQMLLVPTSSASRYAGLGGDETAAAQNAPRGEVLQHRVRGGDTLYAVARRYGTSPAAIAAASGIRLDKTLFVGDRLTVVRGVGDAALARGMAGSPRLAAGTETVARKTHTVRRGDTLWRIAHLYQTSVGALCSLNEISPSAILHPGTRLTIRAE